MFLITNLACFHRKNTNAFLTRTNIYLASPFTPTLQTFAFKSTKLERNTEVCLHGLSRKHGSTIIFIFFNFFANFLID